MIREKIRFAPGEDAERLFETANCLSREHEPDGTVVLGFEADVEPTTMVHWRKLAAATYAAQK